MAIMKMVFGSIAFVIFWVSAVFPSFPFLPIGRTAGSLLGALLMVVFHVLTAAEAYDAIDLPILGLLFGTMVVAVYLERADMLKYLGKLLSWRSLGAKDLLLRICLVSGFSSALFTNDTICVALTEFVLQTSRYHNLSPHPFLLALASSANIGSSATPIGNPQNLVIALNSGISFIDFLLGILPAALLGLFVNALLLLCFYWRLLHLQSFEEESNVGHGHEVFRLLDAAPVSEGSDRDEDSWKRATWKGSVYVVVVGMLISFLVGLNMSWTAIGAAMALVVLDFRDAGPCLDKVSYSILVFFSGMFITVEGFDETGIPGAFWDLMEPYAQINTVGGIAVLAIVILILSNVISNVPTVLLMGSKIAASAAAISEAEEKRAWLVLAWTSTVAGNLTLIGSAANMIVCEQARRSEYSLSFYNHLRFGFPSTLIVTAIGLTLVRT
ncbi:hypothetical protein Nepgr_010815 [Nepenthes gracilis]|uniref:Citrate transporter-like domain-containing protein n=1 Tax=Nepenthes gracilis TaxID=150966 RepID=A0AAD3SD02_NEPGR|nr:hypothetical protein Nepgr_010815 [Nepenthes gracilis]